VILTIGVSAYFHTPFLLTAVLSPIPLLGLVLAGFALGIPMALLSYLYQDASHALTYLNQILFWATPVVTLIPKEGILHAIYVWNPLTHFIQISRGLFYGVEYSYTNFSISFMFSVFFFFLVIGIYRRLERLAIEYVL
jgi:ABC-type polysaccharide/polyol phosphate export permease